MNKLSNTVFERSNQDLLNAVSTYLYNKSVEGKRLEKLNKCELIVYDIDTLLSEVGSGGFDFYLSYYGERFLETKKAVIDLEMSEVKTILEKVEQCFPGGIIPRKIEEIEDIIISNELEFDDYDDAFYDVGEEEIIKKLGDYIRNNKEHFA